MPAGRVTYMIECVPKNPNTGNSVAPCATIGNQRYTPVMVQGYLVESSTANYIESIAQPFDYAKAGAAFGAGLTIVLMLFIAAKPLGLLFSLVKKA